MSQEVVVVLGYPAAGKTEHAQSLVEAGYERLNRDTIGGRVDDLLPHLVAHLSSGKSVVLDNLYPTKASRKPVIEAAALRKVPVRCIWVDTPIEESATNACIRMIERVGRILGPKEKTDDPNLFPIAVLYKYRKEFEKPTKSEGFSEVERVKFVRRPWPDDFVNEALILDYDQTLRDVPPGHDYGYPISPEEVNILPGRVERLQEYIKENPTHLLLGASNQSGIAKGTVTREAVIECFEHTNKLLGVDIDYRFDDSRVPPITSYRRKPNQGIGIELIYEYKLNPSKCLFVGDQTTDATMAKKCGFQYQHPRDFFKVS